MLSCQHWPAKPSVDIFGVGCLAYYVLTGGAHPFGKRSVRQQRVVKAKPALNSLSKLPMHADFVEQAVMHVAAERAPIDVLERHPMCWSAQETSNFLCDMSDRLDLGNDTSGIEKSAQRVFGKV